MNSSNDKRMIADTGYAVMHTIHIGDREILVAENMDDPDGQFYMKAEYSEVGIIGQYDRVLYSASYLTVMENFAESIDRQIADIREDVERSDFQAKPITAEHCYPNDYGQDITGEVVAIKASELRPEYRRGDAQLVFVTHGNGARANSHGTGVFCYHLCDGKQAKYERHQVLGRIKILPEWAKEQIDFYQALIWLDAPEHTEPEEVGGYTIIDRVQVGKMLFVLGENPKAPSPYATWQRYQGRSSYDLGHYLNERNVAISDLHRRANNERENLTSIKGYRLSDRSHAR